MLPPDPDLRQTKCGARTVRRGQTAVPNRERFPRRQPSGGHHVAQAIVSENVECRGSFGEFDATAGIELGRKAATAPIGNLHIKVVTLRRNYQCALGSVGDAFWLVARQNRHR